MAENVDVLRENTTMSGCQLNSRKEALNRKICGYRCFCVVHAVFVFINQIDASFRCTRIILSFHYFYKYCMFVASMERMFCVGA